MDLKYIKSRNAAGVSVGPSDNTSVERTFGNDRAMTGEFDELLEPAFPAETLPGFPYLARSS